MKKITAFIIALLLLAAAAFGAYYYMQYRARQAVTADTLMTRLQDASECTTQKMIYNGVIESESGSVPFINKQTFLMTYKAVVRAGFHLSKTEIDLTDEAVTVTLPAMEIQEVTIDPDEIKTYNTSLTLIKPDGKEELKQALVSAEEDARSKASEAGLLDAAGENAEAVVKGLLSDSAGGREIIVRHR